jgi:hypothetical protein
VDAEPAAALRLGDQEIRALELAEPGRRIGAIQHVVAERGGERAEDRGTVQEGELVLVERRENLAAQVVGHETVVSPERQHGSRRIVDGPQPQPREDKRREPPLGALDEHVDLLRGELEMTANHEQLVRLGGSERQLGLTHLGKRTGGAQTSEPERRIDARDQDNVRVRRKVREGIVDRLQAFPVRHRVQVVEHDDQLARLCGGAVHQLVDRDIDGTARHAEPSQRTPPKPRPNPIDRRRDVPPQRNRIVLAGVQHDPGQRRVDARAPVAHRGRLAIAGRSGDQCQGPAAAGVERPANPRPVDQAVTDARHRELGLDQQRRRVRTRLVPRVRRHRSIQPRSMSPSRPPAARSGRRGVLGSTASARHNRVREWEMTRHPPPKPRPNHRNTRTSAGVSRDRQSGWFPALFERFDDAHRTTENRGVPGSSPGLAISGAEIPLGYLII